MKKPLISIILICCSVCLATAVAMAAAAGQKYALVIGIGRYTPGQNVDDLDGPGPDREAIIHTLLSDYGFPSKNVFILSDEQATRGNILQALDKLISLVNTGDYVFIYYSGHGTSPQGWHGLPIDGDTGALIPSDFRMGGTLQETAGRLVVGSRDMRPRLLQLDSKATVFAILDTCFSQNSMKSIRPRGKSRGVAFGQLVSTRSGAATRSGSMAEDMAADEERGTSPYPYQNVAWISAALAGQEAVDITKQMVEEDKSATIDGRPHGALTNSVLIGLSGAADLNHDGVITHAELYDYLQRVSTTGAWSHQPAWSANDKNQKLPSEPVLGGRIKPFENLASGTTTSNVTVSLEGKASILMGQLAHLKGIAITSGPADLVVHAEEGGYRIYQQGVVSLTEKPLPQDGAVARIAVEPDVRRLVNWTSPTQRAKLQLASYKDGQVTHQGVLFDGQVFKLKLTSSEKIWPLVVDVDVTGVVTVIYPTAAQTEAVPANQPTSLGDEQISGPFGVECLKALAFDKEPDGYANWAGQQFAATDPRFQKLLSLAQQGMADTTARLITQSKDAQ